MEPLHLVVPEEIALEGLDGITLDGEKCEKLLVPHRFVIVLLFFFVALWFRLSERLNFPLPLNKNFCNEIWKLILSRTCFEFFLIEEDRPTPQRLDRRDYYFNTEIPDDVMFAQIKATYYIYSYCPVTDPVIRGSCQEFNTRKKLSNATVKQMILDDIDNQ